MLPGSMDGLDVPRRWTRPIADAPKVDAVALTKAWLVALVTRAPLHRAAGVPAGELARGGPALCAALVAALGTDTELERLAELATGLWTLTAATDAAGVVAGVEALRSVTWRALRVAVEEDADVVGDLADRLAHLCALMGQAALAAVPASAPGPVADAAPTASSSPRVPAAPTDGPATAPPDGVRVVSMPSVPLERDPLTTLADELAVAAHDAFAATGSEGLLEAMPDTPTVRRRRTTAGWDEDAAAAPQWLSAIVRRLEHHEQDGRPFAVLVAEIDGLDRLLAAQTGREVATALEAAERGLTAELAPTDLVVRERLGRWWLTCPDRGPVPARELAGRVAAAISGAVLAGVPLAASVGYAVCPPDGQDLETLASRADEGMFAARAAGVPVA
jgi:GGDEF domain-containing protein